MDVKYYKKEIFKSENYNSACVGKESHFALSRVLKNVN